MTMTEHVGRASCNHDTTHIDRTEHVPADENDPESDD